MIGIIVGILGAILGLINSWKVKDDPPRARKNLIAIVSFFLIIVGIVIGYYSEQKAENERRIAKAENTNAQDKLLRQSDEIKKLTGEEKEKLVDLTGLALKAAYPLPDSMEINFTVFLYNNNLMQSLDKRYPDKKGKYLIWSPLASDGTIDELKELLSYFNVELRVTKSKDSDRNPIAILDLTQNLYNLKPVYDDSYDGRFRYSIMREPNERFLRLTIYHMHIPVKPYRISSLLELDSAYVRIFLNHPDHVSGIRIQENLIRDSLFNFFISSRSLNFKEMRSFDKKNLKFISQLHLITH